VAQPTYPHQVKPSQAEYQPQFPAFHQATQQHSQQIPQPSYQPTQVPQQIIHHQPLQPVQVQHVLQAPSQPQIQEDDRMSKLEKQIESQSEKIEQLQDIILRQSQVIEDHKKSMEDSKRLVESQATRFAVQNLVNSIRYSIDTGLNGLGVDTRELNAIVKKELALSLLQDCDQEPKNQPPLVVYNPFSERSSDECF